MAWEWSRDDRSGLARFVTSDVANLVRIPENRQDLARHPNGRYQIVEAIYNTLVNLDKKIRYAPEKYHPSDLQQQIRTPREILDIPGEGTCLDLALLFCGLCLGNELLPLLIVLEDHALVAVSQTHGLRKWHLEERWKEKEKILGYEPLTDADQLWELIDSDRYLAIECTGFAHTKSLCDKFPEGVGRTEDGILPFERAVAAGCEQLKRIERPLRFAFDIAIAHHRWRYTLVDVSGQTIEPIEPPPSSTLSKIKNKTEGFVGREYVFNAIANFLATQTNGYFVIEADPGVGKTAILHEYVNQTECLAHFNVRGSTNQFLESVCWELIQRYRPPKYSRPPNKATEDGKFLEVLLHEVSNALELGEQLVIAVDALDEVDLSSQTPGANILYLPRSLPKSVYFILTRRKVKLPLRVDPPTLQLPFDLMAQEHRNENLQDVQRYIRKRAIDSQPLREWIAARRLTDKEFISRLATKSDNNFMYLCWVLEEIEQGKYQDMNLESLPQGLEGYYEEHWERMGLNALLLSEDTQKRFKIVYVLAEASQPISCRVIARSVAVDEFMVQWVLDKWEQFLQKKRFERKVYYSIYHASFRDYLYSKDIVRIAGGVNDDD